MKKYLIFLAVAAAGIVACSANIANYTIKGSNAPKDGITVYLTDQISKVPIDSAVVSGGAFAMKGKAEKDALLMITVGDAKFPIFNDGKPIRVDVASGSFTGSELNTKLSECDRRNSEAYAEYSTVIDEMEALGPDATEEQQAELMAKYFAAIKKYADFFVGMIEENNNSLLPVAFIEHLPSLVSAADNWNKAAGEDKLEEVLAANPMIANHPFVLNLKQRMAASDEQRKQNAQRQKASVGERYLDLELSGPDGSIHKLSEYVGRGNWVLVDFWASWCGPCIAQVPDLIDIYKKYHPKGLDIVGYSLDSDKDAWVDAVKEQKMPWVQLADLSKKSSQASNVYSVSTIPDNLLISPDGVIVARKLEIKDLEARLSEIFK
ncbi:MAG: AhpC/TSA family protein [Bacteroidales bacterium]|nr:AhpC/TSA family protein [Bacteroidales bacterium]